MHVLNGLNEAATILFFMVVVCRADHHLVKSIWLVERDLNVSLCGNVKRVVCCITTYP